MRHAESRDSGWLATAMRKAVLWVRDAFEDTDEAEYRAWLREQRKRTNEGRRR